MQFFKAVKNVCTEIHSYEFLNKDINTYNVFLNALHSIKNIVIVNVVLENSKDEVSNKNNVCEVPLVFPVENIEKSIDTHNADLIHISVEYKGKPIEMIVNIARFLVSICMAKEDKGMLEMFGDLLVFAMSNASKHGYWMKLTPHSEAVCSVCMKSPKHIFGELFSYCPHCGSKNVRKDI